MTTSIIQRWSAISGTGRYRIPPSVVLSGAALLLIAIAVVLPQFLATHSPFDVDLTSPLAAPSGQHWLGTDSVGRDLYSRIIWGARPSILIGLGAMAVSLGIGTTLGFIAALAPRWICAPVNRFVDILLAFPVLLLSLLFVALLGPSVTSLVIAVGIGSAPGYARLVRAAALGVRRSAYVEAARALGHDPRTIFIRHIFPNAFRPLVALVTLGVGQSVVWASGLSFLGLGVAPPSPEWGALLNSGKADITTAWWLEVMPGLAIVITALAFTLLGRYIQDRTEGITS
ncbi:MAG: ABC transporter permease [Gordonia sp. (in: high G+C Gram-positive bacteria)]